MSLYGLRGADGRSRETLNLLGVLAPLLGSLRGTLSANDVATCKLHMFYVLCVCVCVYVCVCVCVCVCI
jgi:hypothetical protein